MMLSVTLARIAESLKLDGAMCIDCLASKTNRDLRRQANPVEV